MAQQFNYFKLTYFQIRKFASQVNIRQKSHYEYLGVTPKATQADIKTAYYKLSMVYHPDKNQENKDAAEKFRNISEAYAVLGNVKSRKLYDRGLLFDKSAAAVYEEPYSKFYKSRDIRSRPPAPTGRTVIYDFDEWSRNHYGATFARDMRNKRREKIKNLYRENVKSDKSEQTIFLVGVGVMLVYYFLSNKNYDNVTVKNVVGTLVIDRKTD